MLMGDSIATWKLLLPDSCMQKATLNAGLPMAKRNADAPEGKTECGSAQSKTECGPAGG